MSYQTRQIATVQEDVEDCYSVILLYSIFFKYLPFHIFLCDSLVFNFYLTGPSLISTLLKE